MSSQNKLPTANTGPLAGLKVLDLTRILAGPTCTQLLADLGAEVIKVERPNGGDETRTWGPPFVKDENGNPTSESTYYLCANRNKRSIALDLTAPDAFKTLEQLIKRTDVLIENFRCGGLEKYGLAYAQLCDRFPELIYCSITGFGQTGPNKDKPGYDLMIQGFGGIMSLTGEAQGEPMKTGVAIADITAGLYASTAILAALRHRDITGDGQHIDIALADVQTSWLANQATNYLNSGEVPTRHGNQHPNIVPYQVFAVSDGDVIVAVGNDRQFSRFCEIIGAPELAKDLRFATNSARLQNREQLLTQLEPRIKQYSKAQLLAAMERTHVPGGPINTVPELFATEQIKAREMLVSMPAEPPGSGAVKLVGNPLKFSKTPVSYRLPPPRCGAHTEEILQELEEKSC